MELINKNKLLIKKQINKISQENELIEPQVNIKEMDGKTIVLLIHQEISHWIFISWDVRLEALEIDNAIIHKVSTGLLAIHQRHTRRWIEAFYPLLKEEENSIEYSIEPFVYQKQTDWKVCRKSIFSNSQQSLSVSSYVLKNEFLVLIDNNKSFLIEFNEFNGNVVKKIIGWENN